MCGDSGLFLGETMKRLVTSLLTIMMLGGLLGAEKYGLEGVMERFGVSLAVHLR